MTANDKRAAFEAWLQTHCDYDDLNKSEIELARDAWQAALQSPEVQALRKDAERLEFLIAEECQVKTLTPRKGKWYHLYWPDSEETQAEWFTNPRAAIDAAMEKQK